MKTYYPYNMQRYWTLDSITTQKKNKPPRSTETIPPSLSEGEYAKYIPSTDGWEVTTTGPVSHPEPEAPHVYKWVKLGDMLNIVPDNTIRMLEKIRDDANYNVPAEAADGDKAAVLLAFLLLGNPVDVNGDGFGGKAAWMVAHPSLDITAAHLDEIVSATEEASGGVVLN